MFQNFNNLFTNSVSLPQVIFNLFIALMCGLIISLLYRWTYKGPNYSVNFVNSMILLSMITAIVIMVIGNNLARAFGLVGAMSIIRFRTAVKDTLDIVFIFFALASGMAAGVGMHFIVFAGTIFIGIIIWILFQTGYANPRKKDFLLQFVMQSDNGDDVTYLRLFKEYCKSYKLINLKSYDDDKTLEMTFYIKLKDKENNRIFVKEMQKIQDISHVNLFF